MGRSLLLLTLLAVPLCLADEPSPEPGGDAKTDLKNLQGTWSVAKAIKDGMPPPMELLSVKFTFDKDRIRVTGGPGGGAEPPVKFTLNAKKVPAEIDIHPPMGERMVKGLYKLSKDELTLVFHDPGKDRPKKLDEKGAMIVVLKRDRK
jgi:uncharacterized protein (TIGR03067 family)